MSRQSNHHHQQPENLSRTNNLHNNNNNNISLTTWMEYPHGTGNYIKKKGQLWNFIHQQQCLPYRYSGGNIFHTLPDPYNTEKVFGSKNHSFNYSHKFV